MRVFVEFRRSEGTAPLPADVLFGRLPSTVAPVHRLDDLGPELLPGESRAESSWATGFDGPTLLEGAVGDQLHAGTLSDSFACALTTALPEGERLATRTVLRHCGAPLRPLVTLRVVPELITLTFGEAGAPLVLLPVLAGPAWEESARLTREAVARALEAIAGKDVSVRVFTQGLPELAARTLEDSFASLTVEHAPHASVDCQLSLAPGPCLGCRHANQGTADLLQDELLCCRLIGPRPGEDPQCEAAVERGGRKLYAYEPFTGGNGTWGGPPLSFLEPAQ